MGRWIYFTDDEARGLVDDLMFKLDRARALFGAPLVITSGYRDPSTNEKAGGVEDSAHMSGMAVDLRCSDPEEQKKLCWALGGAGFLRIGVYNLHIHADVSQTLPKPAYWTGISH